MACLILHSLLLATATVGGYGNGIFSENVGLYGILNPSPFKTQQFSPVFRNYGLIHVFLIRNVLLHIYFPSYLNCGTRSNHPLLQVASSLNLVSFSNNDKSKLNNPVRSKNMGWRMNLSFASFHI